MAGARHSARLAAPRSAWRGASVAFPSLKRRAVATRNQACEGLEQGFKLLCLPYETPLDLSILSEGLKGLRDEAHPLGAQHLCGSLLLTELLQPGDRPRWLGLPPGHHHLRSRTALIGPGLQAWHRQGRPAGQTGAQEERGRPCPC